MFAFWMVTPIEATVEVGDNISLQVLACTREDETGGTDTDLLAGLPVCKPSIRQGSWRVNGIVGGNSSVGVAHTDAGTTGSQALYIAPNVIPSQNPVTVIPSMYWAKRNVTKVFDNPPIKITIVGKELIGTASGTVASAGAGVLYDYSAKVTWTRQGRLTPGAPAEYSPRGYVKITPKHRCISALTPDSIPIEPTDATLTISLKDSTWQVVDGEGEGQIALLRYYDTCAKMLGYLELATLYIGSGGESLPVQGTFNYDGGLKITGSFKYLREGESPSKSLASLDLSRMSTDRGGRP
jgi:hypothetical protein